MSSVRTPMHIFTLVLSIFHHIVTTKYYLSPRLVEHARANMHTHYRSCFINNLLNITCCHALLSMPANMRAETRVTSAIALYLASSI